MAQAFDQEAGDQEGSQTAQDGPVFPSRQPGGAGPHPAVGDGHADADDADQAEDVGDQRIAEISGPDEDVDGEVVVDGEQGGDEEEDDHRRHDAEVHDAAVGVLEDALGAAAARTRRRKRWGRLSKLKSGRPSRQTRARRAMP